LALFEHFNKFGQQSSCGENLAGAAGCLLDLENGWILARARPFFSSTNDKKSNSYTEISTTESRMSRHLYVVRR